MQYDMMIKADYHIKIRRLGLDRTGFLLLVRFIDKNPKIPYLLCIFKLWKIKVHSNILKPSCNVKHSLITLITAQRDKSS